MTCAPIALFVYNRLEHTRRTVNALQQNRLAEQSELIIFSDAPKQPAEAENVRAVREYIRQLDGFKSVTVIERATNLGLAGSIIDGVTAVVTKYGRVIVLEDDMLTSEHFLTYMNEALEAYEADDRVISIHGYTYPVSRSMPEAFFLLGADCWGWATWRRGWACFNPDGHYLLDELKRRNLLDAFDFKGAYPYSKMLEGQINGNNDSWAIRWYASAFLAEKLTLYPGRSLIHNIGNDASGTHCDETNVFNTNLSATPIDLGNIEIIPSSLGREAFEDFFRRTQGGWRGKLKRYVQMLFK